VVWTLAFVRVARPERPAEFGTLKQVGTQLFTAAVIPFELIGITLVVAVVGAFAVARGHHKKREGFTGNLPAAERPDTEMPNPNPNRPGGHA
jgi:hypothetical protein